MALSPGLQKWLDDDRKAHKAEGCFWAVSPFDDRVEYCQYCGKWRVLESK